MQKNIEKAKLKLSDQEILAFIENLHAVTQELYKYLPYSLFADLKIISLGYYVISRDLLLLSQKLPYDKHEQIVLERYKKLMSECSNLYKQIPNESLKSVYTNSKQYSEHFDETLPTDELNTYTKKISDGLYQIQTTDKKDWGLVVYPTDEDPKHFPVLKKYPNIFGYLEGQGIYPKTNSPIDPKAILYALQTDPFESINIIPAKLIEKAYDEDSLIAEETEKFIQKYSVENKTK